MYGKGLRPLSIATVAMLALSLSLVFFYAPLDADQGFIQKIFYLHVPLAIGGAGRLRRRRRLRDPHLRTDNRKWDAYSYVSIHISVIFGVAVLITGAIWAKASWGHWWVWDEPTLVSFLIVFLLYATYYPFRYAIEDRDRQARYASVFAVTAGAFVPLNFIAVRMAAEPRPPAHLRHRRRRPARRDDADLPLLAGRDGAALDDPGQVRADREERLRPGQAPAPRPRRAGRRRQLPDRPGGELMLTLLLLAAPALPLDEAGKYVAGAYIVFVVLLVVYVAIMAAKLQRIEQRTARGRRDRRGAQSGEQREEVRRLMAELLALGVSHKTAPLDLRERLSLTEGRAVGALRRADRGGRHPRGGGDLDLQPHRALPDRLRPGRGRVDRARRPHPPGRDPPDRAARPPLLAARRPRRPATCCRSPPGSTR